MVIERHTMVITGTVQGVGFRPFVRLLATELGLHGWVRNEPRGVQIEVEGRPAGLRSFRARLEGDAPGIAQVTGIETAKLPPAGYRGFEVRPSAAIGPTSMAVPADLATCPRCLAELFDADNRRYRYPFINCTQCGPRFTIVESMPYDRPRTAMRHFDLCPACRAEYEDPDSRRFHAQPNACPDCGPRLAYHDTGKEITAHGDDALARALAVVRGGGVLAVKALGGYQLVVDARDGHGIETLRQRKHRNEKPFALLYPNLEAARRDCELDELETDALCSQIAPIVLATRRRNAAVSDAVAPGMPGLGIMLPSTPLYHLIMRDLGFPVVATSANLSDEPMCYEDGEAVRVLGGIADAFLRHDRPIVRPVDDSIVRVMAGTVTVLRRARGYAPLPVRVEQPPASVLALGGHMKGAVGLGHGGHVTLSQHLGDLESPASRDAFVRAAADIEALAHARADYLAADPHPDYASTRFAQNDGRPVHYIQHHHAHIVSCMAEHGLEREVLGIAWDGTGAGPDGTVWGGEFLRCTPMGYARVAHLAAFPLPGGDRAVVEPRRAALGMLYAAFGDALEDMEDLPTLKAFSPRERSGLLKMMSAGTRAPHTSSMGRLFDGVASLCGLRQINRFEGQAAMELEGAVTRDPVHPPYSFALAADGVVDWRPMLLELIKDLQSGADMGRMAGRFHSGVAACIGPVATAQALPDIVLSGGCFQNRVLTSNVCSEMEAMGLTVWRHGGVPPNDGGLALGQVVAASAQIRREVARCA